MLSPHIYAALVRDRQHVLLDEANARRLACDVTTVTPRYREWLARQLVVLALHLAPSLRHSVRGLLVDEDGAALPLNPPADGQPLAPLI
jgi:hypothetical protein